MTVLQNTSKTGNQGAINSNTNFWPHHPTKTINIAFEMLG